MTVLFAVMFAACATVPITGRRQLALVPESQLVTLSADQYRQLISQTGLSDDPVRTREVEKAGRRIAAAAEAFMRENKREGSIAGYHWEFNLLEDPEIVNALCMPGGKVAVFSGILPITENETGLAVVVGHEVAHSLANHSGERLSQLLVVELGGLTLSQALKEKPQQTQQLLLAAYGLGANVGFILPYGRAQEREADRIGLILMARAGYDPQAAIPFWQRMNAEEGERPPEFLSTHPAPESRMDRIRKDLPEAMKYYKK